ncbi:adenosine deaminase [Cohnella thailandensis]|uniref:Adenosine deaminase n=1 Tax=Cohnella thailandensis TaxID=557557 RepID=A0A841STH1_9BACL|nr:adenosine deaminase [Cohnella thailandensis]MBB6635623.1 adenosine deaminase [Cohnella thailandensis]MBP1975003.1 adenosine deaminase [Cohnella thailandensis]
MHLIKELPKVDLHLHLDGGILPSTILELAAASGASLPASGTEGLLPYMQVDANCESLVDYLEKFNFVLPFLQDRESLKRAAFEIVESAAADNCIYIEVRFAPLLHIHKGLTVPDAIRSVIEGLNEGEARYGVKARVIAICMRHQPIDDNLEVVRAAALFLGKGLVAVDLAGDEANHPPARFREVFALARQLGIPYTIHAGEAAGADSIEEAIEGLGAVRIGHGVRLRENPALLEVVLARQIPLELCPTSNIQTKAVSGWADYPIRDYWDRGLLLTVNTDNPTVSGTSMTGECEALAERFRFTIEELASLMRNALNVAFLPANEKAALREEFDRRLSALGIAI